MPRSTPITSPAYQVKLSPAPCSLDLGDGSERGEYVDQDHILTVLGRPHRCINLMYCYYPYDKGWPKRASEAYRRRTDHAWSFPYDDYFPFTGGPKGNTRGEVFRQMRDIRRHGQDVTLTLTMDCAVTNDHIRVIARQLRPFGRLRLRLNHECDGFWFSFNRRYSYEEVGKFFTRFASVFKKEAPEALLMCCWGHVEDFKKGFLKYEKELSPLLDAADVWSVDQYVTLDYGYPCKPCDPENRDKTYRHAGVGNVWSQITGIHKRFVELTGRDKGLEIGEFNADGNVGGEAYQAKLTEAFYHRVLREKPDFLKGITYYQFRDRARLGLERQDPNNPDHGTPAMFLPVYRKLLQESYFQPGETWTQLRGRLKMEWRSSDDSDGLGWKIPMKGKPIFLELLFDPEANLMIRAGSRWVYKKPGVDCVDLTAAAAEWEKSKPFPVAVFAPPGDGTNPGGVSSVRTKLKKLPQIRLLYKWGMPPGK